MVCLFVGVYPWKKEPVQGTPTKAKCDQCHGESGQENSLTLCGWELRKKMGEFTKKETPSRLQTNPVRWLMEVQRHCWRNIAHTVHTAVPVGVSQHGKDAAGEKEPALYSQNRSPVRWCKGSMNMLLEKLSPQGIHRSTVQCCAQEHAIQC